MTKAQFPADQAATQVSRVSDLVGRIRSLIEQNCPLGWISGEISNLTRAASGHIYFTLKDERAQIRCAMWRNRAQLLAFRLEEGMSVEVRAQATVYEARGDLQLSIDSVRRAGPGSLYEAFLRLKARLEAEGLFDPQRKRPIPPRPAGIAIVTSPSGAALQDILNVMRRRAPAVPLTIYPCLVQGDAAPARIAAAIREADARAQTDGNGLLLVCRGGGSIEDLFAFNHESVVRAIAACSLPVISGVGHETDTTLTDFVADLRAPTPSAAAEIASAGWFASRQQLPQLGYALRQAMSRRLKQSAQRTDELERRLTHPRTRLQRSAASLEMLGRSLRQSIRYRVQTRTMQLDTLQMRLTRKLPDLRQERALHARIESALHAALHRRVDTTARTLSHLAARLEGLNPDAVLARGYAIVRNAEGVIMRDATETTSGQSVEIQLARGRIKARVEGG